MGACRLKTYENVGRRPCRHDYTPILKLLALLEQTRVMLVNLFSDIFRVDCQYGVMDGLHMNCQNMFYTDTSPRTSMVP